MTTIDPYRDPQRVVIEDGERARVYRVADGRFLTRREADAEGVARTRFPEPLPDTTPPAITIDSPRQITVQVVLGVQVDPTMWARTFGVRDIEVPSDVERYVVGQVEDQLRHAVDDEIRVVKGVRR